jgi:pimeloyl-ACP methyl ester carboxylesterase
MPGPVLLVQGACSPFVLPDLDRRLAALPGYEVVRIDDAGHNVHHDAPDALARALAAFLTTTR